jgi:hypothetical protein
MLHLRIYDKNTRTGKQWLSSSVTCYDGSGETALGINARLQKTRAMDETLGYHGGIKITLFWHQTSCSLVSTFPRDILSLVPVFRVLTDSKINRNIFATFHCEYTTGRQNCGSILLSMFLAPSSLQVLFPSEL